jgi:hypothetical protein
MIAVVSPTRRVVLCTPPPPGTVVQQLQVSPGTPSAKVLAGAAQVLEPAAVVELWQRLASAGDDVDLDRVLEHAAQVLPPGKVDELRELLEPPFQRAD